MQGGPLWPACADACRFALQRYLSGASPIQDDSDRLSRSAGWVALLVVQAGLVSYGNGAVHRRVGRPGAGLLPVMVITGDVSGAHRHR